MQKSGKIIFFVGTTAEYIKVFTIIDELKSRGVPLAVIATGQNEISKTDIATKTNLKIDCQLTSEDSFKKNVIGLFSWFFKTLYKSPKKLTKELPDIDFTKSVFVVHGDTLSTVMGAFVGKKLGAQVAHVEAGLRSFRWFTPFPEEIDRHLVSGKADINFAPGDAPVQNLKKAKGTTVNTFLNTIIDGLTYSKSVPCKDIRINCLKNKQYCVFVFHRQENLLNKVLLNKVVDKIKEVSEKRKVVFILHAITKSSLINAGRYNELVALDNILLLDRVEYFDFMKLLDGSEFVVTDGGSNQEELAYMGKPTLVLRKVTERQDGLGENALLYGGNVNNIDKFIENYSSFKRSSPAVVVSPSVIISDILEERLCGKIVKKKEAVLDMYADSQLGVDNKVCS